MSGLYQCLVIKIVILCCVICSVHCGCRPRCKLGLENKAYRTCLKPGTGCRQSPNAVDRCYEKWPARKLPIHIQEQATISVSSTRNEFQGKENIFSGDDLRCFRTKSEDEPFLEITFKEAIVIDYMFIKGRADQALLKDPKNLFYLQIWLNGISLPKTEFEHNPSNNIVKVTGSELNVTSIKFTRPKPGCACSNKWFINICGVDIHVSGGFK